MAGIHTGHRHDYGIFMHAPIPYPEPSKISFVQLPGLTYEVVPGNRARVMLIWRWPMRGQVPRNKTNK